MLLSEHEFFHPYLVVCECFKFVEYNSLKKFRETGKERDRTINGQERVILVYLKNGDNDCLFLLVRVIV